MRRFLVIPLVALAACKDQPQATETEIVTGDQIPVLWCKTPEAIYQFWETLGSKEQLEKDGTCTWTRSAFQAAYVTKRIIVNGKPYACIRPASENECRWADTSL